MMRTVNEKRSRSLFELTSYVLFCAGVRVYHAVFTFYLRTDLLSELSSAVLCTVQRPIRLSAHQPFELSLSMVRCLLVQCFELIVTSASTNLYIVYDTGQKEIDRTWLARGCLLGYC